MLARSRCATRYRKASLAGPGQDPTWDTPLSHAYANATRTPNARALLLVFATFAAAACSSNPPARDRSCSQSASELKACPRGLVVQGIDVSVYQGPIDWTQVRAAGIDFGVARISDGATTLDSQFEANWKAMKTVGVIRGSYQYFRASENAMAQASLVVSALNRAGGLLRDDLPVVMDIETADNQSTATVRAQMTTWLDAVAKATGRSPVIYTNPSTSSVIGSRFGSYALWVANWGANCPTMPAGWSLWRFWQYASGGSVPGISGVVDLDEFDGPYADLMSFAVGGRHAEGGVEEGGRAGGDADVVEAAPDDAGVSGIGDPEPSRTPEAGVQEPPEAAHPEPPDAGATMGSERATTAPQQQRCPP